MSEPSLLMVCLQAFTAVMTLLAILTGVMRLVIALFPEEKSGLDTAVVAAINQAVSTLIPGVTVTHIEEVR